MGASATVRHAGAQIGHLQVPARAGSCGGAGAALGHGAGPPGGRYAQCGYLLHCPCTPCVQVLPPTPSMPSAPCPFPYSSRALHHTLAPLPEPLAPAPSFASHTLELSHMSTPRLQPTPAPCIGPPATPPCRARHPRNGLAAPMVGGNRTAIPPSIWRSCPSGHPSPTTHGG